MIYTVSSKFHWNRSNPHTFYDAKSIDDFDFKDKNWSKKGYSTNVPQSGDNGSSIVHHGNDDDRSIAVVVAAAVLVIFKQTSLVN